MQIMDLEVEILNLYFTSHDRLIPFLKKTEKEAVIRCLVNIIDRYANDVNSSALREDFTLIKTGYSPSHKKLGYNGKTPNGRPCDVKPINVRSGSGNKLNGGGNFTDFTYERLERYLKDNVLMLVSGFVDGCIVYILEFSFSYLEKEIRRQLDKFFQKSRRAGEYLRSASFSFKHYKDSPDLRLVYKTPNLDKFRKFLTKDLYLYLRKK